MQLIDLSVAIDADAWDPNQITHEIQSAADNAKEFCTEMAQFGLALEPNELPGGELLVMDNLTLNTHTGTHIDAPAHYGSAATITYGRARTIAEVPLDWFYRPGVLLDLQNVDGAVADAAYLEKEIARIGYTPQPQDIVLLRSRAAQWADTPMAFSEYVGLDRSATELLLDHGVRVIGTDAASLDPPLGDMITRFRTEGDQSALFPSHMVGREREYCQIERLSNLDALPGATGFTVCCFPVKIARAGAGWTRVVALVND
ncbi:cyclase family protein [Kutzneria viridogrisea]|uniref:Cyclase n=1 Tax=Kutzneria viridogrisea TaxID=47990 RepID=A0ABR6BAK1_9PSEU|nr:cyclase [Kutzneria viridogrisea]